MITSSYLLAWVRAFVFTQAVEVPIYMRVSKASFAKAFGASLMTHPVLWFVIFPLLNASFTTKAVIGELWAWLGEAVYLTYFVRAEPKLWRAVIWSLLANGASLGLGELCRYFFGYP